MSASASGPLPRSSRGGNGPWAELIADVLATGRSEHDLATMVTEAAWDLNGVRTTVHASTISRWLAGSIARPRMRRWLAHAINQAGIDISTERIRAAADAQEAHRRSHSRLRNDEHDASNQPSLRDALPAFGSVPLLLPNAASPNAGSHLVSDALITVPIEADGAVMAYLLTRRSFLTTLAATVSAPVGALPLEAIDRTVTDDLKAFSGMLDRSLLEGMAALTRTYAQLHNTVSPQALWWTFKAHTNSLVHLAHRPGTPSALATEAGSIASQSAILTGWTAYNLQLMNEAWAAWVLAGDLAQEARDSAGEAHALACRSRAYSGIHQGYVPGQPTLALALLDRAVDISQRVSRPLLQSWIFAVRAQQLAAVGRPRDAKHDLDEADRLIALPGPGQDGVLAHWTPERITAYRGMCALVLREHGEVITVLEPVLARLGPDSLMRCLHLSDVAAAYALQGEVDHACALLAEAVQAARLAGFPEGARRARGVRATYLTVHSADAAVRHLDELTADVTPGIR